MHMLRDKFDQLKANAEKSPYEDFLAKQENRLQFLLTEQQKQKEKGIRQEKQLNQKRHDDARSYRGYLERIQEVILREAETLRPFFELTVEQSNDNLTIEVIDDGQTIDTFRFDAAAILQWLKGVSNDRVSRLYFVNGNGGFEYLLDITDQLRDRPERIQISLFHFLLEQYLDLDMRVAEEVQEKENDQAVARKLVDEVRRLLKLGKVFRKNNTDDLRDGRLVEVGRELERILMTHNHFPLYLDIEAEQRNPLLSAIYEWYERTVDTEDEQERLVTFAKDVILYLEEETLM